MRVALRGQPATPQGAEDRVGVGLEDGSLAEGAVRHGPLGAVIGRLEAPEWEERLPQPARLVVRRSWSHAALTQEVVAGTAPSRGCRRRPDPQHEIAQSRELGGDLSGAARLEEHRGEQDRRLRTADLLEHHELEEAAGGDHSAVMHVGPTLPDSRAGARRPR